MGEHDAAIARYRRVLEVAPASIVALNNLAFALAVRRGSPAEALPYARRAASLAPRTGSVLDTLGWIEHLLGNDAEALRVLTEAIRHDPQQAEIRLHAAVVHAALGDKARAEAELKEALKLNPKLESSDDARKVSAFLSRD